MGSHRRDPLIVLLFKAIRRHYAHVADALHVPPGYRPPPVRNTS